MSRTVERTIRISETVGEVEALFVRPEGARWLLVLAHGAGAGMRHPFMEQLAYELASVRMATLRYQFPYLQGGRKRPDPPAILKATVRAAIEAAAETAPDLPLLAGGKSMGARMTSLLLAESTTGVTSRTSRRLHGLVCYGFPLHPAGRPSRTRGEHLTYVPIPMLFLQGTRDSLADLALLRPLCERLSRATLHVIDTADHGFHVLKRSGTTDGAVLRELARLTVTWADSLVEPGSGPAPPALR